MVMKSKKRAGKYRGLPAKILVPVPGIILVKDLEREIAELKAGKDKIQAVKEHEIAELKEDTEREIAELKADNDKLERENTELKKQLDMQ